MALVGPRQSGKTTLARQIAVGRKVSHFFDLEDPAVVSSLSEPLSVLGPLRGLVILDEIQRRPELFPLLCVLADRRPLPARFLVLGSASPELLRQASESLAGRLEVVPIGGFALDETGVEQLERLWILGACRPPSRRGRTRTAWPGGDSSSRRSWSGTCRSSGSGSRHPLSCASGPC